MRKYLKVLFLPILFFAGCGSVQYSLDDLTGFAQYKGTKSYRAISANGCRFKISTVKNKPQGSLAMWQKALSSEMKYKGYLLLTEKELKSKDDVPGILQHYKCSYKGSKYDYFIGIYITESKIYLLQFGGEEKYMKEHQKGIDKSLKTLQLKK